MMFYIQKQNALNVVESNRTVTRNKMASISFVDDEETKNQKKTRPKIFDNKLINFLGEVSLELSSFFFIDSESVANLLSKQNCKK